MVAGRGFVSLAVTVGLIGAAHAVSLQDGEDIDIDGSLYTVQTAGHPWSLQLNEPRVLRFELRQGDVWRQDAPVKERTEIAGTKVYDPGDTIRLRYVMRVAPGPENKSEWLQIGQFHDIDEVSPAQFAIELVGEHLAVHLRASMPDGTVEDWFAFTDDEPIVRGRDYTIEAALRMPGGEEGSVDVWVNGEQVLDYTGYIGYGGGVYWKQGIYRAASPETLVIEYRDISVGN